MSDKIILYIIGIVICLIGFGMIGKTRAITINDRRVKFFGLVITTGIFIFLLVRLLILLI